MKKRAWSATRGVTRFITQKWVEHMASISEKAGVQVLHAHLLDLSVRYRLSVYDQ